MNLILLAEHFVICRFPPSHPVPSWFKPQKHLMSITYTSDECSIVCPEMLLQDIQVTHEMQLEKEWRAIKVRGPLDFSLTGILASLANPLTNAGIPLFALSTFDTDYILVKNVFMEKTQVVLERHGHTFVDD